MPPEAQPRNNPLLDEQQPTEAQIALGEKIRAVLMYIGTHTQELQSDLKRIHLKCELFRKNKLCVKCVFFLDAKCVFWDKHYQKFTEGKNEPTREPDPVGP